MTTFGLRRPGLSALALAFPNALWILEDALKHTQDTFVLIVRSSKTRTVHFCTYCKML